MKLRQVNPDWVNARYDLVLFYPGDPSIAEQLEASRAAQKQFTANPFTQLEVVEE